MKARYLLLVPLGLLLAAGGALLALPGFVAAQSHRPAMERFASALTGRQVHIAGKLSLTLLPQPRLTATKITISGPAHEVISAKALSLDIAVAPLLHGQLAVQTLDLDSPVITFPWPLPGGPSSVAPPPWLATLHAHLSKARITLGQLSFSGVGADLFTGPDGAVSISGNGQLLGQPVTMSLALGQLGLDGTAPLSVQASSGQTAARFSGTLDAQSMVNGQLTGTLPGDIKASATLAADGEKIALSAMTLRHGGESLSGSASYALATPALTADLIGQNLTLDPAGLNGLPGWLTTVPAKISLEATNVTLLGQGFPALSVRLSTGAVGTVVQGFTLSLPGGGGLAGNGAMAGGGQLTGQLTLAVPDSAPLLAAYHLPPLPGWPSAHLTATLGGTQAQPVLQNLAGTLGRDHVAGTLVLGPGRVAGTLGFDHLALAPLAAWAGRQPPGGFTAALEVTADTAEAGPVTLTHLRADAAYDGALNMRHISASLYGGLAAGSFTLDSSGRITAAQGFVDLPSATPLAALIPAAYAPPPALLKPRLSLLLAARGPADALAASAVLRLGQFTLTTSPVIDLTQHSASGALTLQHPEAILVAKLFGFDQGLIFPGAGSAALRARFTATPDRYGLNDFVLSFGALNASGQVMVNKGMVNGRIDATNLALPPLPADAQFPSTLPLQGRLALDAARVIYGGQALLGQSRATLSWSPQGAQLDVAQARFGNGTVSGSLGVALTPSAPPAFTARLLAQHIDAAALALPLSFPYPVTSGTLNGSATLKANGLGLKGVMATLAGTASLEATTGRIAGFNLAGFAAAPGKPDAARRLYGALEGGSTSFDSLKLGCTIANGNCTLSNASLAGPGGTVTGSGGIDFYDQAQALKLVFTATSLSPPATAELLVLGNWAKPKHIAHIKAALDWTPLPPPPPAPAPTAAP